MRLRATLLMIAAFGALASPVAAQERRPPPKQQEGVVQQPAAKPKPASRPAAAIATPIPRNGAIAGLPADPPVAPRIGGLEAQQYGGAACRTSCSKTYIFCQQQDDAASCSASWARCQAACPAISSSE